MFELKNAFIRNFAAKMEEKYGFAWWDCDRILRKIRPLNFTQGEIQRGQQLVKPALYHIRRFLKDKSLCHEGRNTRYLAIVAYFATRQNLEEILNLGGFPIFWENKDRGLRLGIFYALSRLVEPGDEQKILAFQKRIEQIKYLEYDEEFDLGDDHLIVRNTQFNRYDREDFQPVLDRVQQPSALAQCLS